MSDTPQPTPESGRFDRILVGLVNGDHITTEEAKVILLAIGWLEATLRDSDGARQLALNAGVSLEATSRLLRG